MFETTNADTTATGGPTWYQSSQTFTTVVSALGLDPAKNNILYAGLADGTIYKTTNAGDGTQHTYTQLDTNGTLANHFINSIGVDPQDSTGNTVYVATGNYYAGTAGYVWKTTDGGST